MQGWPGRLRRLAGPFTCAAVLLLSAGASADEVDDCISAHPEAQRLRNGGKLQAAREHLLRCSRDSCPAAVRTECARLVDEVESKTPTIVVDARDGEGHDLVGVRVRVDGEAAREFRGTALTIDPGAHRLRFEHDGSIPTDGTVMIREGEKSRVVLVTLRAPAAEAPKADVARRADRPVSTATVLFGTLGVLGVGGFTLLALSAKGDVEELRGTCKTSCKDEEVSGLRTKLVGANVSLGIGLVSLGIAAVLYLTRPARLSSAASLAPLAF